MDDPTRRSRWRSAPVAVGVVLLMGLLATRFLAPQQVLMSVQSTMRALASWARQTLWTWPLAAALALAALSSPPARRRWSRPTRRIRPAIGMFVVLVALTTATAHRPAAVMLAVGVAVAVGLLAALVLVAPRQLAPPVPSEALDRLSDRDRLEVADARLKLQNDVRTTALQAIAGLAILAGAVLGFQQLTEDRRQATATQKQALAAQELTRQGQASQRFTRAVDQLGSDRADARLGGVYGLEQIARQAPDNRLPVTEVLVAFLHRQVPRTEDKPPPEPDDYNVRDLNDRAPDAQAALTVLARRETTPFDPRLDLRSLDLHWAELVGADLNEAFLIRTVLVRADLRGADLVGANLRAADLRGAVLVGANLRGAELAATDLSGATADVRTGWPDGFDWQGAGVQLKDEVGP
jgi:Pentapeptide repeats (8 copies)